MTTHQPDLRTDHYVAADEDDDFERSEISIEEGSDRPFSPERELTLKRRWADVQRRFVDDPRDAVAGADDLVNEVMDGIGDWFAERRSNLGRQWTGDDEVETEDLRLTLQRYRHLFERLLSL